MKKLIAPKILTKDDFVKDCNFQIHYAIGTSLQHTKGFIYSKTEMNTPLFNAVVRCPTRPKDTTPVAEIVQYYQSENLPHSWWVDTDDLTSDFKKALDKYQKKSIGEFLGLSLQIDQTVNPEFSSLSFDAVKSENQFLAWSKLIVEAFELPSSIEQQYADLFMKAPKNHFQHLLGSHQGKYVVSGSVLCQNEFAFIYNLATNKDERGQGYASNMLMELINLAKQANCTHVGLVSSPQSLPLYKKMGFREQCTFEIFI